MMPGINISGADQFLHENLTWERTLDFHLQENAFLKTRLSQVLDNNTDKTFIALAEYFQNSFVNMDECIKDIRQDIIAAHNTLNEARAGNKIDENKLLRKQQKLRNEMGNFEKNFAALKNEFNQYLVSSFTH